MSVDAQPFRVVPRLNAPCNGVETIDDCWGKCLFSKLVVEELQALAGIIQLPLGLLQERRTGVSLTLHLGCCRRGEQVLA